MQNEQVNDELNDANIYLKSNMEGFSEYTSQAKDIGMTFSEAVNLKWSSTLWQCPYFTIEVTHKTSAAMSEHNML